MKKEQILAEFIIDQIWDDIHEENYDIDLLTRELNKRLKEVLND